MCSRSENGVLCVNRILLTRDGRKIGNAIIEDEFPGEDGWSRYRIRTDYGSTVVLRKREIEDSFFIGAVATKNHKFFQPINSPVSDVNMGTEEKSPCDDCQGECLSDDDSDYPGDGELPDEEENEDI